MIDVEIKIWDETLRMQVEEEDVISFLSKFKNKTTGDKEESYGVGLDESKWKVHPFYTRYEVHPEGYVRLKDTKTPVIFTKYRKELHHKPQFINSNIIDDEGSHTVALHKLVADTFVPIPWYLQGYNYTDLSVGLKDGDYENREAVKAYNLAWYVGRIRGNTPMIKLMDLEDDRVLYFASIPQIENFIRDNKLDPKRFNYKTE